MEKITTRENDQLLNYLDGQLEDNARKSLEEALQSNPALQTRLEELKAIHDTLQKNAILEVPSRNFTQRVMKHLDAFPVPPGFSPRNGILLLCGVLVAVGIALMLLRAGTFDPYNSPIKLDSLIASKEWIKKPLPSIPFNGKLFMNVILIIATGISFLVLDRTVLRPVFNRRLH